MMEDGEDQNLKEYYPVPQPHEISKTEKEDAMGAYLMMFAALGAGLPLPLINLIASVVYYFINRHKSRFVRFHLLQSLWSQLPVTILNGVLVFWAIKNFYFGYAFSRLFMGFLLSAILANLVYIGFSLYAAARARQGGMYYFIFFGRLAYHQVFKIKDQTGKSLMENKPPM